jgi:hypothetical protein
MFIVKYFSYGSISPPLYPILPPLHIFRFENNESYMGYVFSQWRIYHLYFFHIQGITRQWCARKVEVMSWKLYTLYSKKIFVSYNSIIYLLNSSTHNYSLLCFHSSLLKIHKNRSMQSPFAKKKLAHIHMFNKPSYSTICKRNVCKTN